MSLLRLLTTGKTLEGIKDVKTRYRVNRQGTLPKFGSARNPFRATDKLEPAPVAARRTNEESLVSCRQPPAEIAARTPAGDPLATSASPKLTASLSSKASGLAIALSQVISGLWGGWRSRLSARLSRPRDNLVRVGVLQPAKLAMQGELSLDKVKVVRNDLSETDWEIAPVKQPTTQAPTAPGLRPTEKGEPGATSRGRSTLRAFGAGKT